MKSKTIIALTVGAAILVGATAAASAYFINSSEKDSVSSSATAQHESVTYNQPRQAPLPACDDDNIVGKVIGGAAGGVAGSQVGKGNGKTAATIGGTVAGSLIGEEYLPTKNVTCR